MLWAPVQYLLLLLSLERCSDAMFCHLFGILLCFLSRSNEVVAVPLIAHHCKSQFFVTSYSMPSLYSFHGVALWSVSICSPPIDTLRIWDSDREEVAKVIWRGPTYVQFLLLPKFPLRKSGCIDPAEGRYYSRRAVYGWVSFRFVWNWKTHVLGFLLGLINSSNEATENLVGR